MNILSKSPDKYSIVNAGKNCHRLVKVLNVYDNDQQALGDLTRLIAGEITESDLAGNGNVSDIEAGKLRNRINVLEAAMESNLGLPNTVNR